jgi:hypothetical protein
VESLADRLEYEPAADALVQALFDRAYARDAPAFRDAFADARDLVGRLLARCWSGLRGGPVTYARVMAGLLAADRAAAGGRHARIIRNNAYLRDIGRVEVGPRLTPPDARSHSCSARTITPTEAPPPQLPRLGPARAATRRSFRASRRPHPRHAWTPSA